RIARCLCLCSYTGTATPDAYTLSLHDALPISLAAERGLARFRLYWWVSIGVIVSDQLSKAIVRARLPLFESVPIIPGLVDFTHVDRKSTRLNSSHLGISYAVFCLKKKKKQIS